MSTWSNCLSLDGASHGKITGVTPWIKTQAGEMLRGLVCIPIVTLLSVVGGTPADHDQDCQPYPVDIYP